MTEPFYHRNRFRIFAFLVVAACVTGYGAFHASRNISNHIIDWLPAEFEETKKLLEFVSQFGSEEFVMVSWPGCTLEDPRVAAMAKQLRQPVEIGGEQVKFFEPVMTGPEVLDDLEREPLELDRDEALERLEGILVGPDQETTCIVLALADPASVDRHQAIGFIRDCADRVEGLSRDSIYLAGNTVDSVVIDEASQSIGTLSLVAFAVSFVLALLSFRQIGLAILVFVTAVFNQQITLALVHYSGWHMDTVLLMAPPLVYVLSISAGVHLVNYYGDAVREGGLERAPERAVGYGLAPCLMAAFTTSLGLIALQSSYLVPLQRFGLYGAGGVLIGVCVLFLLTPACLSQWPARRWAERIHGSKNENQTAGRWSGVLSVVSSTRWLILLAAATGLVVGAVGVERTKGTAFLHDMFDPDARIVKDYNWLERNVGPLVPVEVVLRTPLFPTEVKSFDTPMLDSMRWVEKMQDEIASVPSIEATVSALTFAPTLPRKRLGGLRLAHRARETAMEKTLRRRRDEFVRLGYLRETDDALWWRISGHVPAGLRADYDKVMADLERKLAPVVSEAKETYPQSSMIICGGLPLVQDAQKQMVTDLVTSFSIAFGLIAASMIGLMWAVSHRELKTASSMAAKIGILVRTTIAGLIAMIPNVLPCLLAFGAMGWLEINVEIGTVMTAAAAMGIAVDDTLHFVVWFRRGVSDGLSRRDAVQFAYQRCGAAMIQTTLICGLGLLVFAASPFGPTARFAWLMFTMLGLALVADLFVLPAMLVSHLGWFFAAASPPVPSEEPARSVA